MLSQSDFERRIKVVPVSMMTDELGVNEDFDPTEMVGTLISHQA